MKDVKLEKKSEKVFTKRKVSNTIKKNYDPLKVNYKIYEREGFGMESKNERKKFVELLFKICLDLGVENSQKEIENFLNKIK